jgi:endonuclease-3
VREIRTRLARAIPDPEVELDHGNAWELLIATILSAQSTDKTVNRVTPELFRHYPTPAELGAAPQEAVEAIVKSTGFFRQKAKAIREVSRIVAEEHGGEVPKTIDALTALPGVARKTANVVLGAAYAIASGIVVDTHVGRVARRLGLTRQEDPEKVEQDLCAIFAKKSWIDIGHRLLLHGRYLCLSRKPDCARCPLAEVCPAREAAPEGRWTERADREQKLVASHGESGS